MDGDGIIKLSNGPRGHRDGRLELALRGTTARRQSVLATGTAAAAVEMLNGVHNEHKWVGMGESSWRDVRCQKATARGTNTSLLMKMALLEDSTGANLMQSQCNLALLHVLFHCINAGPGPAPTRRAWQCLVVNCGLKVVPAPTSTLLHNDLVAHDLPVLLMICPHLCSVPQ